MKGFVMGTEHWLGVNGALIIFKWTCICLPRENRTDNCMQWPVLCVQEKAAPANPLHALALEMVYLKNQAWAVQAPHGRISLPGWNKCAWTCSQASKNIGLILSPCWNRFLCHLIHEDLRRGRHYLNQWKLEKLKHRGFLHLNNLRSLKYILLLFSSHPEAWPWAWLSVSR